MKFGHQTAYQQKVNSLAGALGPSQPAFWKNTYKLTGPAYNLSAQPLYFAPSKGFYVTSADVPAANYSVDFSNFGFGRKRRSRRSRRGSKRKRSRRNRKSRSRRRPARGETIAEQNWIDAHKGLGPWANLGKNKYKNRRSRRSRRRSRRSKKFEE